MINKINKTKTVGSKIDPITYAAIEKIAKKERRTISDLVRLWIEDRLAKEKAKKVANG